MLIHLIHKKVNEIFTAYQKHNNIVNGDIDPIDAAKLKRIEESLEELIERVCSYQQREYPASYTYRTNEGISYTKEFDHIDIDKFFTEVSNVIALDDCTDYTVTYILFNGKEVYYAGWQPKMVYEYKDSDGNTVWVGNFPEWDH